MIQELRDILARYINRQLDVYSLEDWVVSHLQAILNSQDQIAIEIANQLDPLFVELGEDLVTEPEVFSEASAMYLRAVEALAVALPTLAILTSVKTSNTSGTLQSGVFTPGSRPVLIPV